MIIVIKLCCLYALCTIKLHQIVLFKIIERMKLHPIALLYKQTSRPDFRHSTIYCYFLYDLFLILHYRHSATFLARILSISQSLIVSSSSLSSVATPGGSTVCGGAACLFISTTGGAENSSCNY